MSASSPVLVQDVFNYLNEVAPLSLQASYDNAGIITGNLRNQVNGILICLDSTETIIDEAISLGINTIIAHHPIVFKGLKSFTGSNYVERTIIKAIKSDINLLAWHTNLDSVYENGVSTMIADKLDLLNTRILQPSGNLNRIDIYGEQESLIEIQKQLVSNNTEYKSITDRITFECDDQTLKFWTALFEKKEQEGTTQFSITRNVSKNPNTGYGIVGELKNEIKREEFFDYLKQKMDLDVFKYTKDGNSTIKTVALCGGSGSFLLSSAMANKADVYITGDMKYHEFFDGENQCTVIDIGHYESEKYTIELLDSILSKKFSTFAIRKTGNNTNPIEYYYR